MKSDPFFSVVVPAYNRIRELLDTINTILKQTFTDFELIIVDDGSTDGTEQKVREKYSDERIKIIKQVNSERGAARNNGFRNAKGTYVVLFDSDDVMHKNHLQVLHENILLNKYPEFIANKFDFVSPEGKHYHSDIFNLSPGFYDYTLFLNGNPLACNVCVKRNTPNLILFEENRNYAIKEDWLFLISNLKNHKIYIGSETTVSMLDHDQRSMRSDNRVIIERTMLANKWINEKVSLTPAEKKKLLAHVNYFCGIHSYLDSNRSDAVKYSTEAIRNGGLKLKYILLLLKSIIGRKAVKAFS